MMKIQKIWLGVFVVMFVVPEILWGALISSIASIFKINFHSLLTNSQVFSDHPIFAYLIICTEIIGIAGLLHRNLKNNYENKILKNILSTILVMLIIMLLGLLYLNYAMSNISFP
ncbi:hypothetical protein A3F19_03050 [Candidatus Nomurabacteria bacterium RIFCSPHIGHO2_12_FULL_37_29]|uniref:Uncharacterized protein n=2 Tax=Candidatus Nomuraibacteriota TaxID=1752729 RepID=A0A1F6WAN7_9BACT|nr:MAG: hypothetical protein A3F19_03050 [Candidatus Nomurabacteria bacterium RIFCSPHIGHO2_12_FULL_37_29]OGI84565.1 MAG: hypothetical protein A3A92_02625 [Candidatus Nomurabacteria bacterium RIFCSPLOWO2_01_FULL_37_49]